MKYKVTSETKANLFISLIKAQMYEEYKKNLNVFLWDLLKLEKGIYCQLQDTIIRRTLMILING